MKKLLLLLFVISLAFVSCTDTSSENEELLKANTQSIDKEDYKIIEDSDESQDNN